jgi:hypothetical protein
VYEIIRDDISPSGQLSKREFVNRGWCTADELARFVKSANDQTLSGEQARHARETGHSGSQQPPIVPMTLAEAEEFINRLVRQWLDTRPGRA